jgi:hypothetical protein
MSKQTRYYLNALFLLVLLGAATAADAQVDQQRAQAYFKEAQALCERDGGKLWGVSLCGPMVFADAATKTIATSQPAPDAARPKGLGFLNAPVTWGGIRWSAYMWTLIPPSDAQARGRLFLHELFHRIQPELKLMAGVGENDHLDTLDGRYWLQLEWRALSRALTSSGAARATAISDALAFRRARRTAFPAAAIREAADEIREGLAEYTGVVVTASSTPEAIAMAVRQLAAAEQEGSFVRRFHAASGPAYGLLLDAFAPGWTRRVTAADDLAQLLTSAAKIEPARDAAASAARYRSAELRVAEEKRDVEHQARVAGLKARFVDGPVLIVPRPTSAAINNTGATSIPDVGLIIMEYRSTPAWGSLTATSGVLVLTKGGVMHLTAPFQTSGSTLSGEGWTITLAAGWTVRPGKRPGDFEIVKAGN